ncbi:hypothetical protein PGB90_008395 [Kerria lacca]
MNGEKNSDQNRSENGERYSHSRSFSRFHRHSDSLNNSQLTHYSYHKYRSRSRSRSRQSRSKSKYSPRSPSYSRRRSRSINHRYSKKNDVDSVEHIKSNKCLGVFGLSIYTTEHQIKKIFSKYGNLESVQVIFDGKTGRSKEFCFVYYENDEDAKIAKEQCTGMKIDGHHILVDFSITPRGRTPSPKVYMSNSTKNRNDRKSYRENYEDAYIRYGYGRSSSPYRSGIYRSRYNKSRSRSYSSRPY